MDILQRNEYSSTISSPLDIDLYENEIILLAQMIYENILKSLIDNSIVRLDLLLITTRLISLNHMKIH